MGFTVQPTNLSYPVGSVIFKEGDHREYLYIVKSGQIAIFKLTAQNERIPLAIINSGEYLGETGLLDGKQTHATWAYALTDVELIAIPADAINDQLKTVPQWLIALCRGMSQKLRSMNDLVKRNRLSDNSLEEAMQAALENANRNKKKQK